MDGVRVEDAGSDFDALGVRGDGGQDDDRAAQEQVIANPELVKSGGFRCPRQLQIIGDGQVVIQAQAELHGAFPMMASTSISIRCSGSINRLTSTIVLTGRMSAKNSPCAREYSCQRLISVTNMRTRTTSFSVAPASFKARSIFWMM